MRAGKQSVNLASINLTVLRSFPVPLPPSEEQRAIVEATEDHLSIIDHVETDIGSKQKSAGALRQAILRHAFAGMLVPQDPNDEPASALLARIAVEREARAREAAETRRRPRQQTRAPRPSARRPPGGPRSDTIES
jgi:type I restriction enzyme S subunit